MTLLHPFLLGLFAVLPGASAAQELVADAFGLYRATPDPSDAPEAAARALWADTDRVAAGAPRSVLVFAGPKTMVAGADRGHLVALSFDAQGNLAGERARFVYHGGRLAVGPVRFGLADHLFDAGPVAGDYLAAATVDGVQSQRADYSVTAELASLTPGLVPPAVPSAPDTALDLALAPMQDRFGNPAPDGIALTVMLQDAMGRRGQASALSLGAGERGGGVAPIILRDIAGPLRAVPVLGSLAGEAVEVTLLEPAPLRALQISAQAETGIDAVSLRLGPLETTLGYLLPDGTLVDIVVQGASGARHATEGWVLAGHVAVLAPVSPADLPIGILLRSPLGDQWGSVTGFAARTPLEMME